MKTGYNNEGYYQSLIELQEKLRRSEEERLALEEKFNKMVQSRRNIEQIEAERLKSRYRQFVDEDRLRSERNEKILRALDRIEYRAAMLTAKTDRLRLLRRQYESYLRQYCIASLLKSKEENNALLAPKDSTSEDTKSTEQTQSLFPSKFLYQSNAGYSTAIFKSNPLLNRTSERSNYQDQNHPSVSKAHEQDSLDQHVSERAYKDPYFSRKQDTTKLNPVDSSQVPNKYAYVPPQETSKNFEGTTSTKYYDEPLGSYDYITSLEPYDDNIYDNFNNEIDMSNPNYNLENDQTRQNVEPYSNLPTTNRIIKNIERQPDQLPSQNVSHQLNHMPENISADRFRGRTDTDTPSKKITEFHSKIQSKRDNFDNTYYDNEDNKAPGKTISQSSSINNSSYSTPSKMRQRTPENIDPRHIVNPEIQTQRMTPEISNFEITTANRQHYETNQLSKLETSQTTPQGVYNSQEHFPDDVNNELEIRNESYDQYYEKPENIHSNQRGTPSKNLPQQYYRGEQEGAYQQKPKTDDLTKNPKQFSRTSSVSSDHKGQSNIYANNYSEHVDSDGKQNYNYTQQSNNLQNMTRQQPQHQELVSDANNFPQISAQQNYNENHVNYQHEDEKLPEIVGENAHGYEVYDQPVNSYENQQDQNQYETQVELDEIQTENVRYEPQIQTGSYENQPENIQYETQDKRGPYENQPENIRYETQDKRGPYENQPENIPYETQDKRGQYENQPENIPYETQDKRGPYGNQPQNIPYETQDKRGPYENQPENIPYETQDKRRPYGIQPENIRYETQDKRGPYENQPENIRYETQDKRGPYENQPENIPYETQDKRGQYENQPENIPYETQDKRGPYGNQPQNIPYETQDKRGSYGNQPENAPYETQDERRPYENQPENIRYETEPEIRPYDNRNEPNQYKEEIQMNQYETEINPNQYGSQGETGPYETQFDQNQYERQAEIGPYETHDEVGLYENQTEEILYKDQVDIDPHQNQIETRVYDNQPIQNEYENQSEIDPTLYENQTKENLYENQTEINPYPNQAEVAQYDENQVEENLYDNQYNTNAYENQPAYGHPENDNVIYEGQEYPENAYVEGTNEGYEPGNSNAQVYYENQGGPYDYTETPENAYPYEENVNFPYNTDANMNADSTPYQEPYITEENANNFQQQEIPYETQEINQQRATPDRSQRVKTPINQDQGDYIVRTQSKTELLDNIPVQQISLNVTAVLDSDTDSAQISEQQLNSTNKDESDFEFSEIK